MVKLKRELKKSKQEIAYRDPKSKRLYHSTIGRIASRSLTNLKFNQLISNLANWKQYHSILETGTSLGFNSLYLNLTSNAKIYTIEGSEQILNYAKALHLKSSSTAELILSNLDTHFEYELNRIKPALLFLDADHRSTTLLKQIETIKHTHIPDCIIVHDIYWSRDMSKAWQMITEDAQWPLTIDLFQAGIIFTNFTGEKQHFHLRF